MKMTRALSENDVRALSTVPKRKPLGNGLNELSSIWVEEEEEQEVGLKSKSSSLSQLFQSFGLDESVEGWMRVVL